jgi:transcriptional regulator with XRE-family HTH domain
MEVGQRIKEKRLELGWSQEELAAVSGASQSVIDRVERGQTRTSKHLNKILVALGLGSDAPSLIPIVGYIGGGQTVHAIDDHVKGDGFEQIEAPAGVENGIGLIVRGDSMAPRYRDGDIVIVDKVVLGIESLIGDDCYIKLADGRCYLKTLAAGSRPGRYTLHSIDGPTLHDVAIELAYPVAWIKPRRK